MNAYPFNPLTIGQATFNPYNTYQNFNPYSFIAQNPVMQQGPHMEIQRVNGKESAYAYAIGPNSSVILADSTEPKIWLVTTDSSGFKAVNGFRITPDEEEPKETPVIQTTGEQISNLEERMAKLEERMNSYGQSDTKPAWKNKSGNGCIQPNDRNGTSSKGPDGGYQSDGSK